MQHDAARLLQICQAKLVHEFQGRGINRVSAKITQKVRALLEDRHIHAGTREEETRRPVCRPQHSSEYSRLQWRWRSNFGTGLEEGRRYATTMQDDTSNLTSRHCVD